jgi:hypothetical protein
VAVYEGEYFLCEVTQNQEDVAKGYTRLSYTTIKVKTAFSFAWGEKPDGHDYSQREHPPAYQ